MLNEKVNKESGYKLIYNSAKLSGRGERYYTKKVSCGEPCKEPKRKKVARNCSYVSRSGVFTVPYFPQGGGEFIKSVGEEYRVVRRGKENKRCGKD